MHEVGIGKLVVATESGCSAKFFRASIPEYNVDLEIKEPLSKPEGFILKEIDQKGY